MSKIFKHLQLVSGRQTFVDVFWNTIKYALMDGKLNETVHLQGPFKDCKLVGTDKFGNQYFERMQDEIYGRHRWVVYADKKDYDSSTVPPEWHGWLHYICDENPVNHKFDDNIFKDEWNGHYSMYYPKFEHRYFPKGHWRNSMKRNWRKVQYWSPPPQQTT